MKIKYGETELEARMTPTGYSFRIPGDEDWHNVAGDVRHLIKYIRHYMHIERNYPDCTPEIIG